METLDQQRQHYLNAMGISTWLPTQTLEGAAPSPEWYWGEIAETVDTLEPADLNKTVNVLVSEISPTEVSSSQPTEIPTPVAKVVPSEPAADSANKNVASISAKIIDNSEAADATASKAISPKNTVTAPPRFRLAMVVYEDALVIVQLPMDVLQALAPEHQRLILRILQSIGLGQGEVQTQLFAWPIVNNPNVDQGLPLAQASIQQLTQRMNAAELPLLVFGEQMSEYLGLPESILKAPQKLDDRVAIQAPTLNELMSIPGLKRELWEQLQPFKALLLAN